MAELLVLGSPADGCLSNGQSLRLFFSPQVAHKKSAPRLPVFRGQVPGLFKTLRGGDKIARFLSLLPFSKR